MEKIIYGLKMCISAILKDDLRAEGEKNVDATLPKTGAQKT